MITNQKTVQNYTPWVITLTVAIIGLVGVSFFFKGAAEYGKTIGFNVYILPLINAILNGMTSIFLFAALAAILRKNVRVHRRFIYAAFTTTGLFLPTYLVFHFLSEPTRYGGVGVMKGIYYVVLLTHIVLAMVIVPLALVTLFRGLNNRVEKHRKIARWTMPLWLYVSITGVIVYLMISPYYPVN